MACWPRGTGPRKLAHYCGRHSLANFTIRGDDLVAAAGIRRTDRRAAAGHQGRAHECDGRAALQVIRDARSECETRIEWSIGDIGMELLTSSLLELITQTSTNLPPAARAPKSVDSLTGKNSGDNLGAETPVMHFDQWERDSIEVKLILKGGGCENKNIQ